MPASAPQPAAADSDTEDVVAAPPRRRVSIKDSARRGSEAWRTEGKISDLYTVAGGKPIGKGGFGEVRLGTRKADGRP